MTLWPAFVIGLVGSLHCIGMCGPIAVALPIDPRGRWSLLAGRLTYNLGRVITYSFLGAIIGLIGQRIYLAGYQQGLSIALGLLIIFAVFLPSRYTQTVVRSLGLERLFGLISTMWGKLFRSASRPSLLAIGLLNGFLPCGFVYVGLAGALTTTNIVSGALYMALFGLGTVPIMLALSLAGNIIGAKARKSILRLVPAMAICLALIFILRGLALGIPYLSPKLPTAPGVVETGSCCH